MLARMVMINYIFFLSTNHVATVPIESHDNRRTCELQRRSHAC